jgi:hypothetical protein
MNNAGNLDHFAASTASGLGHVALEYPADAPQRDLALQVPLCRYDAGGLIKETMTLSNTKYVAISHIWRKAEW